MPREPLPPDFIDKPFWQRWKINLRVLLRRKAVKTVCCETFRIPVMPDGRRGIACAGCPTRYNPNSTSPWYRFLGRWSKKVNKPRVGEMIVQDSADRP